MVTETVTEATEFPPEEEDLLDRSFKKIVVAESSDVVEQFESDSDYSELDTDSEEDAEAEEKHDPLCPRITISKEEHKRLCRPWRRSLIIKFLGKSVRYNFLKNRLQKLWNPKKGIEMIGVGNDYYVVRFLEEMDYYFVMEEGPWLILGHYVIVKKWRPMFDPKKDEMKKVPLWIRVEQLPIEYYDKTFMWKLGNILGKTRKVDVSVVRSPFARLFVEVDLRKTLISKFELSGRLYRVYYEGLDLVCFGCGVYGIQKEQCPNCNTSIGSRSRRPDYLIGWEVPATDWVKVNVDGSCRGTDSSGCGGVLRDCTGSWICGFSRNIGTCNVVESELWGILSGLEVAWSRGFRKVIVEADSQDAIRVVKNGEAASGNFGDLICRIQELLKRDWDVHVVHVLREANKVADTLAKFSHNLDFGLSVFAGKPPKFCRDSLKDDFVGVSFARGA